MKASRETAIEDKVAVIPKGDGIYDLSDDTGQFFIPNINYWELAGLYYQLKDIYEPEALARIKEACQ